MIIISTSKTLTSEKSHKPPIRRKKNTLIFCVSGFKVNFFLFQIIFIFASSVSRFCSVPFCSPAAFRWAGIWSVWLQTLFCLMDVWL